MVLPTPGALSPVPYAEPGWLSEGFKSPYYNDGHRALQKYMRAFNDEFVVPEAQAHEKSGERVCSFWLCEREDADGCLP